MPAPDGPRPRATHGPQTMPELLEAFQGMPERGLELPRSGV